ncbi:MAG: hypothetical protein Q7U91_05090 [Sideroxyarcus sp.]|nr:hypothetical protein [Sideroxyarcus sp.]
MTKFVFVLLALLLEASSLFMIAMNGSGDGILLWYLLLHAAASFLLAVAGWYFLAGKYRQPRWLLTLLMFNFAFFIPVLGLPGVFVAVLISGYRRRTVTLQPFASLVMPEFVLSLREPEIKFSQGGIKSRLVHSAMPTPQRLQSLLALQGIPARVSSPLLQNMLGDASDDIRLVAYGLLDGREKKITAQIHRELVNLRTAESKELQLVGLRHLAELYWEMIYAGLAQGDLRMHALNQALFYADSALKLASRDTGLLFLKGRILLELKRYEESRMILEQAITHGLPESRALPYIVEIAFNRRDYATVQVLLERLSVYQLTPIMKNAIQFWVKRPEYQAGLLAKENHV